MSVDILELRAFYASPLGLVARRRIGEAVAGLWGPLRGQRVLGLGFAIPFLAPEDAERTIALMPATQGVVAWPEGRPDDRRHWHSACWSARGRRGVKLHRSKNAPRYG